jgi:DNA-binding HxlR family transcriptional regulator
VLADDGVTEGGGRARSHRAWTPLASALLAAGDNWTLMIVQQLAPGRMRLRRLQERLPGISAGVLERYVQQMEALGLLTRSRYSEMPPRVELELTRAGRELLPVAGELARWGMRSVWSSPRVGERVDVVAVLRMLPVLLEDVHNLGAGTLTVCVEGPEGSVDSFYEVRDGRLCVLEDDSADGERRHALVRGDAAAWIAALGPEHDLRALRFSGARAFARAVLNALPRRA